MSSEGDLAVSVRTANVKCFRAQQPVYPTDMVMCVCVRTHTNIQCGMVSMENKPKTKPENNKAPVTLWHILTTDYHS